MTLQADTDEIRQIEAEAAPSRFARGWHCLGLTERSRDGKPHAIQAFGTSSSSWPGRRGRAQRARRLLPAHGRRPHPGHGEGRRDRLPVPRLALGRRRQVQGDPYARRVPLRARTRTWHDDGAATAMLFVWHDPEGNAPRRRRTSSADLTGVGTDEWTDWTWDSSTIANGALPRDHRQRRRHGALLLHPLRVPDVLQEHLRGPRRHPVHGVDGPAGHGRRGTATPTSSLKSEATYFGPSFMINWLDVQLQGLRDRSHPDQLPLPDRRELLRPAVRHHRQEARGRRR